MKEMKYGEIRPLLSTGDVIAFSGKGRVSELIKWRTGSRYSHVGFVYRSPTAFHDEVVFLAESTTLSNVPDAVFGQLLRGVQLAPLSQRLARTDGEAWWLPIKFNNLSGEARVAAVTEMWRWIRERRPYDHVQAMGAGVDWWDKLGMGNEPDFSSLFCSEMVSRFHQLLGLLPKERNASEDTPADVCAFPHLGEPVSIKT